MHITTDTLSLEIILMKIKSNLIKYRTEKSNAMYKDDFNMNTNSKIEFLEFKDEKEWHDLRKHSLGGSDMGAILGLNKYRSPLQVYKEKVDNVVRDMSDNVNVKKGKELEDFIRTKYVIPEMLNRGYSVKTCPVTMFNTDTPFIHANLDGLAIPNAFVSDYTENIVIEIKWVSEYNENSFYTDEYNGIPAYYYAQVQTYMYVTGAKKAILCALFDSTWTMHYFEIPRNETFIAYMVNTATRFYNYNFLMKIPPKYDSSIDKEDICTAVENTNTTNIEKSVEMSEKITHYKEYLKQIKELEDSKKKLLDDITNMYIEGKRPADSLNRIKISTYTRTTFDTAKFKAANSSLYNQYTTETKYTRTSIT